MLKIKDWFQGIFDEHFTHRKQFVGDPNLLDEPHRINLQNLTSNINQHLLKSAYVREEDIFSELDSDIMGLTADQITEKYKIYGPNQVAEDKTLSWYRHLWISYKNPFNLLLTILAMVAYLASDMNGAWIISVMVIISTVLRFVQERRSNLAADQLKAMVSNTATVFRNNQLNADDKIDRSIKSPRLNLLYTTRRSTTEVSIKDLVPGDIVVLSAGDMIPADLRIFTAKDLFISQSTLTGESLPVEKFSYPLQPNILDVLGLDSIGFMGTNVVSGTAMGIVIATGKNTLFGNLAEKVVQQKPVETSFQHGINRVSWLLIYFMLIMVPIVLLINGFTKHNWMEALLFALSIAVGLTPEMLPMIVTSNLAKGAIYMSRRKVIVKRLDAIQNFGAMDILCTDKTGTLTQDKICLEKHIDIFGSNCDEILEYAYLNSYYQTGLKNLLDVAVLDQGNFGDIPQLVRQFKKIDEVPFDFNRKRMSVVVSSNKLFKHTLICKGAVEEMLECCSHAYHDNQVLPLTPDLLTKLRAVTTDLNTDGLRVVAVAIKDYVDVFKPNYTVADESNMILVGYIAFMDPPKETAAPALKMLTEYGVAIKILTGDNELVAAKVCRDVGVNIEGMLLGTQIDALSDLELGKIATNTTVFAKLTPTHKERIVTALHNAGHVVGFMGDGINDAAAIRVADIGISVDAAVDIAKEAADIILLEKSLMVLGAGVREGRRTFANMLKYIKITASSNFGNVFSVLIASAFLPFLPMLPIHLLIQNLMYDISQVAIPFDNVDQEFILKPQKWNPIALRNFMLFFGPLSSIFDVITFIVLWKIYHANSIAHATLFQSGWFLEGVITQMLIVHMIRTRKIPFVQSMAGWPVVMMTLIMVTLAILIPMTSVATYIKMTALPLSYFAWLIAIVFGYMTLVQCAKGWYAKIFGW